MRPGRAIQQALRPFLAEAPELLVGGMHADAGGMGRLFHSQAVNEDAVREQSSTARAQSGMFMQVHPGFLGAGLAS